LSYFSICGGQFVKRTILQVGIPPSLIVRRIISLTLMVAFVWVGAAALLRTLRQNPGHLPREPEISADLVLGRLHSADAIENALQSWKADSVFLFIAPQSNPNSTKVYYELLTLAYPRPISAIMCASEPGASPAVTQLAPRSANVSALIFYDISPGRWSNSAREMAPQLYLTSYTGAPAWESFCP
jgi:hypothetical protein